VARQGAVTVGEEAVGGVVGWIGIYRFQAFDQGSLLEAKI
jgi:hypothetical protein